jgi:hypothetical protein
MNRIARHRLFRILTEWLLAQKYRYYVLSKPVVSDASYDRVERIWEEEGYRIGLKMEDYGPWVDFPTEHPLANTAIQRVEANEDGTLEQILVAIDRLSLK